MRFVRLAPGPRIGRVADGAVDVLDHDDLLAALRGEGEVVERVELVDAGRVEVPEPWRLLPPAAPEVWCAGVTYERSRDARLEEARTEARDVYSLVYEAERPELFLKDAAGRRTVGPGEAIRVRSDSRWMVPEPELGLVLGEGGALVGATVGNDVSSRDIEGENPLYIPQAKVFAGACALGPAVLVPDDWSRPFTIRLRIWGGDGATIFEGETSTERMRRTFEELASWVVRDNPVPAGSVLLTGTGLVPPDDYTLEPGHTVEVEIPGIGALRTPVA